MADKGSQSLEDGLSRPQTLDDLLTWRHLYKDFCEAEKIKLNASLTALSSIVPETPALREEKMNTEMDILLLNFKLDSIRVFDQMFSKERDPIRLRSLLAELQHKLVTEKPYKQRRNHGKATIGSILGGRNKKRTHRRRRVRKRKSARS